MTAHAMYSLQARQLVYCSLKHQKANAKRPRNVHGGFRAAQVFAFGYVLAPKGVRSLCGVTRLHFVLRGEVNMMRIGVQQLHSG
jgi:hypothetical protein